MPAIGEWQLIRRCEPAVETEIHASPSDPKLTEAGIPMQPLEGVVPSDDGSTIYEIERVLSASKVGNRYKLLIQWKGYSEPTYEWKSDITSQTMNDELLHEIATAIDRCKESLHCRNHGLRVHRPTVTTVTPRTYSTIYVIQPPSSLSAPIPPPAAHDRQDAASHTCRPRRYPGVLAQLERIPSGSYPSATPPALPGTVFLY